MACSSWNLSLILLHVCRRLRVGCAFVLFLFAPAVAQADETGVPWKKEVRYSHFSQQESIVEMLRNFATTQNLQLIFSPKVEGEVSGLFHEVPPEEFLVNITKAYDLIWYYDGLALYVYTDAEMLSKGLPLDGLSPGKLKKALQGAQLWDARYAWRPLEDAGILYVSGPPRYVEVMEDSLRGMRKDAQLVVHVFPLKHAWADDRVIESRNKSLQIPGVATILRNILQGSSAPVSLADSPAERSLPSMQDVSEQARPKTAPHTDANAADTKTSPSPQGGQKFFITTDPRRNAVIVRDLPERLPLYEDLIAMLDVPVSLIEIQVTIVDIDVNKSRDLGIDWRYAAFGRDANVSASFSSSGGNITIDSLNPAESIGFLAKIRMLEEDGSSRILARPTVLTTDNTQAVLDHNQTFYVRVEGQQDAKLYPVTIGTLLRVTPHILQEDGVRKIQLQVSIEDGDVSTNDTLDVDRIPRVNQSTVNTQAVVNENESLVIGGYYREENSSVDRKVPVLGDIPIIGQMLFQNQSKVKRNLERVFMITPRIVQYSS